MTELEATVGIALAVIPAASAIWMRYHASQDAKAIRDEAAAAALALKAEAAEATLKAREAAVTAKETGDKVDVVVDQLDGRLTQFFKLQAEAMEAREKRLAEARDDGFVRGAAAGRALTVETEITKGQAKIEQTLEKQDVKSEARHVELKNGTLNGTLNGSKRRKP